jgi:hypothetical protein
LILAVSTRLYSAALACAPDLVLANSQAFRLCLYQHNRKIGCSVGPKSVLVVSDDNRQWKMPPGLVQIMKDV